MNKKLSIEFPSVSEVELEHRPPYAGQGKENGNRGYVNLRDYSSAGLKDKNGDLITPDNYSVVQKDFLHFLNHQLKKN